MSYPAPDINDMPTASLIELQRTILATIAEREMLISKRLCPYCKQPLATHACRYQGLVHKFHNYVKD